tara:strand:+ start:4226 stop:4588 length:363 start_codon:yes stop_codon:yes gene_type:complete
MTKFLAMVQFFYIVVSVFGGIAAFGSSGFIVAISGALSPIIAWFGGAGMRGALFAKESNQKITGIVAGAVFLMVSLFWINYTGYWIGLFDITISGPIWSSFGFAIGFVLTTKKHAENKFG